MDRMFGIKKPNVVILDEVDTVYLKGFDVSRRVLVPTGINGNVYSGTSMCHVRLVQ